MIDNVGINNVGIDDVRIYYIRIYYVRINDIGIDDVRIDDVRIYERILSEKEIEWIFNNGNDNSIVKVFDGKDIQIKNKISVWNITDEFTGESLEGIKYEQLIVS